MKKTIAYIFVILAVLCIAASVFCIIDFNTYYSSVANNPAASGVDFLMIGIGHGLALFGLSVLGFACSIVPGKLSTSKFFKTYSIVGIVLFALDLIGAVYLFFM